MSTKAYLPAARVSYDKPVAEIIPIFIEESIMSRKGDNEQTEEEDLF